jgi:acyl-CoA thioester hydrolase
VGDGSGPAGRGPLAPGPASRPGDTVVDSRFRYVHRLQVRFRDLDALGHVNHALYLTYVEQARTMYCLEVMGLAVPDALRWVVATQRCDYLAPLAFADVVDVGWKLNRVGRSSIEFEFELASGGRAVARGGGVMVWADPRAGRAVAIPEQMRRIAIEFDGLE